MSLTKEESDMQYKENILENRKPRTTESPLKNNKEVLEQTRKIAGEKYGLSIAEEIERLSNPKMQDVEVNLDGKDIGMTKESLNFDFFTQMIEDTNHIPGYDIFENDLGLNGESYKAMKKCLTYYHNSIRQDTISYSINNRTKIDNRIHMLIISSAGAGKTTIKNCNKRVLKDFTETEGVIEVSGISHPEQLVGKNIYKGKGENKTTTPIKGLLGYKCLMNDESQDMLNEKNDIYAKSQRIKRLAMDSYGLNLISKKLVDDAPENVLEYYSPVRICDFAHPEKLKSAFFDTGSFRRYYSFNISADSEIDLDNIVDFKFDISGENKKTWKDFLDEIYDKQINVQFESQTLRVISYYHKTILYYLLKHKNKNASRYALLTRYSLRDLFSKNVLILSKARGEKIPSLYTTICACSDTILFILKTIETYNDLGDMGMSSDVWRGASEQDVQALEYLLNNGATTQENSNITIKQFQTILCNFYGIKITQARSHHYRLKKEGFIDSKQIGSNDTRVWLKFIPQGINLIGGCENPFDFWSDELEGDGIEKRLLSPLKQLFNDDKAFEKGLGDGGVGLMTSLLIKLYIRVEVDSNKNKINKYIESKITPPKTPSPPSPLKEINNTPTTKIGREGDKPPQIKPTPIDKDIHYLDALETQDITSCDESEVLEYVKTHPKISQTELLGKFGAGVYDLKRKGVLKI